MLKDFVDMCVEYLRVAASDPPSSLGFSFPCTLRFSVKGTGMPARHDESQLTGGRQCCQVFRGNEL